MASAVWQEAVEMAFDDNITMMAAPYGDLTVGKGDGALARLDGRDDAYRLPRDYPLTDGGRSGGAPAMRSGWQVQVKEILDRTLAALLLVALLPVMLAVALLIKLDSKGPVLFRQKRYGLGNRLFEIYKFRTIKQADADHACAQQTRPNDPRVTRIGSFLRRTSLDELPQFLNVLKGDMSLVGPRPHAVQSKAGGRLFPDVAPRYWERHNVKPGITGWAQVNGWRGETDTEEKLRQRVAHDLEYIENWSLWYDLRILLRTPRAALRGDNAY